MSNNDNPMFKRMNPINTSEVKKIKFLRKLPKWILNPMIKLKICKDPFDDGKKKFSIQLLRDTALALRSEKTKIEYQIKTFGHTLDEMGDIWENDIQTQFINDFHDLEDSASDLLGTIDGYASFLDMAAYELRTKKVDLDKSSVLEGKSAGPIVINLESVSYLQHNIDLNAHDPYFARTQEGVSINKIESRKNSEYLYNVYDDHIELVKYTGLDRNVVIPSQIDGIPVTHIGIDCFSIAWRVKFLSITIPEGITTILPGAFRGCQYIRDLDLPSTLKYIGNYAFAFLSGVSEVKIPENVVSIGMGAFRNCDALIKITIPDSVLRIGNDCFYRCKALETVIIGNSVVDLDGWAFRSCEHLKEVTIGNRVMKIGDSVFYDCVVLDDLAVPESVKEIGEHAFYQRRGMQLEVHKDSYAEEYAKQNRLKFKYAE